MGYSMQSEKVNSINKENLQILITDPMNEYMLKSLKEKGFKVLIGPGGVKRGWVF